MASDEFVAAVAGEMERVLNSPGETWRLGLGNDRVLGWRREFSQDTAQGMAAKIRTVARDTGIQLDNYEPHFARGAAEVILSLGLMFHRHT